MATIQSPPLPNLHPEVLQSAATCARVRMAGYFVAPVILLRARIVSTALTIYMLPLEDRPYSPKTCTDSAQVGLSSGVEPRRAGSDCSSLFSCMRFARSFRGSVARHAKHWMDFTLLPAFLLPS